MCAVLVLVQTSRGGVLDTSLLLFAIEATSGVLVCQSNRVFLLRDTHF
jgi:hypothetical protein